MTDPREILEQQLLQKIEEIEEVYANSGLGKWFGKGPTGSSTGGGWDRYNTSGKNVGKCGDAAKGSSYSACLGKKYATKLRSKNGKKSIANWVKRKKAAQNKHGRGKKGSSSKGKSPIAVKYTNEEIMNKLSINRNLHEMNYTGAVGIHEFIEFYNKATTEEEKQMQHCMENKNVECVKSLITRVTGIEMDKIKEMNDYNKKIMRTTNDSVGSTKPKSQSSKKSTSGTDVGSYNLRKRKSENAKFDDNHMVKMIRRSQLKEMLRNEIISKKQENLSEGWKDLAAAAAISLGSMTGVSAVDKVPDAKITQTAQNPTALNKFLNALHQVESSGRTGHIVGDNGKALGPLQIHKSYWEDVKHIVGGNYNDVENLNYAKKVVLAYLHRYGKKAFQQGDWETLAKIHNGGPNGAKNPNTQRYWEKLKKLKVI